MYGNDVPGVHLLNRSSIAPSSGNSIELPCLTNNTSLSIVIVLLWNGGTLFMSVSVIQRSNGISLRAQMAGPHASLLPDTTRLHYRPLQHTTPSVKVHCGYVHIHFLLIMSFLCLWLLPGSALGLLISEYIINNLHVISFVLIIFVWQNVSLHGECWGCLAHLEAHRTPRRLGCISWGD